MAADRIFGLSVCALALAFLLLGVPTISDDWLRTAGAQYFTVGPRLFPYIAGALCLVFGAVIALRPQPGLRAAFIHERGPRLRVLLLALLTVLYAGLLDFLGFVVSSAAMLLVFMFGFGIRSPALVLPVALLLPFLTELLFRRVLLLYLPSGLVELPF